MTLKEAYEKRRRENLSLQAENSRLKKDLENVSAGLFTPAEKTDLIKRNVALQRRVKRAEQEAERYHKLWDRERGLNLDREFAKLSAQEEAERLRDENAALRKEIEYLRSRQNLEAEAKIKALSNEVARLSAMLNNDGTNSGTPTSKTPTGKKKRIPNSREKTGRTVGGQKGHSKASLDPIPDDEVTEHVEHTMDTCPDCGTSLERFSERFKDELDYEVKVIKRRHVFVEYVCPCCGKTMHEPIPKNLKERIQYGENVQATALSLINLGFVSVGRSKRLMEGMLTGISPSQSYIINLQKRYSKQLKNFASDVRRYCLGTKLLYWDDTVVFMNTVRGCMRFYGDERVALYKAHEKKDKAGLDEDNILNLLSPETIVMHDHNTVNYNDDYNFINAECVQHLLRDLQKLAEVSHHEWASELKELITSTIHKRKLIILENGLSFSDDEIGSFFSELNSLLRKADDEFIADQNEYYTNDERRLIARLRKYRDNYFMWVKDFNVPTSNNLSERSLRMIKCHEKVSGQFHSAETAGYFADIRTYLETCLRNGVGEFDALSRLTSGNPYALKELLPTDV